jgi:hypothetical protein
MLVVREIDTSPGIEGLLLWVLLVVISGNGGHERHEELLRIKLKGEVSDKRNKGHSHYQL